MATRPRHMPAGKRRAVTVEAVVELAARQNPTEITTTAIARHMGVTQGALFKHFPTKDAILQAVMEWVAEQLLSRLDMAAHSARSPLAAVEAMFMAHVDFVAEHPGVPRMLFGELQRAELTGPKRIAQTLINRYRERLQKLIDAGKSEGEVSPGVETAAATTLFIGTIQGLVMQSLLAGDVGLLRQSAPGVFAVYRRGIGSRQ